MNKSSSAAQCKHYILYNCAPVGPFKHTPRPSLCPGDICEQSAAKLSRLTVALLITTDCSQHWVTMDGVALPQMLLYLTTVAGQTR